MTGPRVPIEGYEPTALAPRQRRTVALISGIPGGYEGARDRRAFKDWYASDTGPNTDTLGDLPALRARSLDLERNAPIAAGAMNTMLRDVIGDGLVPKPRLDAEYLGLSPEEAKAWSRQAMRIWWAVTGSTQIDLARRLTFAQLQRQALFAFLSGGDCFPVLRFKERPGDLLATKVQVVEANRVSQPVTLIETDRLRDGVEVDADGMVVAVHFSNRHPNERYLPLGGPLTWTRTPVRDADGWPTVLQVFEQRRPGQLRGVPYLAPVIETLKNLSRYSEAELMAAVVSSMFTVFIKGGYGPGLQDIDLPDVGTLTPEQAAAASASKEIGLGTGSIVDLADGESIEIADPKRPNAQFDPFFLAMCRQLGAALEIPYEQLINHFQASYSASRAALLNAWRAVRTRRGWFVDQFCQPVYNQVIREAVARGMLVAPGFGTDPLATAAWLTAEWTGPAMPEIDPVKAVTAAAQRVKEGFSTREREAAELTGTDYDENFAQRVAEESARRAAGLDVEDTAERVRTEPVNPERPARGAEDGSGKDKDADLETE